MKILSLLIFLASIRTCTRESSSTQEKRQPEATAATERVSPSYVERDTVIVTVLGMYYDDFKTRGLTSDISTKLSQPPSLMPEFFTRFAYPALAKQDQIHGSCTVQFAVDAASKIHYFSVLRTDSKIFSDDVREAVTAKPITFTAFPTLPKNVSALRTEIRVDYKLRSISKL